MGAGKTAIGRRIATRLQLPFVDADQEIESAAGCTIAEFFERYGEPEFRIGERRVIRRLMDNPTHILATGGGAFIDPETRALIKERGLSLWLRAELDVLVARTARRAATRPLLRQGDPAEILARLMEVRYPIYAEAEIVVDSTDVSPEETVAEVLRAIEGYLVGRPSGPANRPASCVVSPTS